MTASEPPAGEPEVDPEEEERLREGMEALSHGRLPAHVRARLAAQRRRGHWSSNLSVAQLAAIRSAGFTPAGQVMGSAVYHVGQQGSPACLGAWSSQAREMTPFSDALRRVREVALTRMTREAEALEGHGVVGARVEFRWFPEVSGAVEFTAMGTAIRREGAAPLARPFLSGLDGQDFAKLLRAGLVPCGLTMGICTIHVHPGSSARAGWIGAEVPFLADSVNRARLRAAEQVQEELRLLGADGVVGSRTWLQVRRVSCRTEPGETDHVVQFTVVGTAVARFAPHQAASPAAVIHLQP